MHTLLICIFPFATQQLSRVGNSFWNELPLALCGAWWLIGRFEVFRLKGRWFESPSGRHVGILGKSFTQSLWHFGTKLPHSIRAVSGAPLSRSGLEKAS